MKRENTSIRLKKIMSEKRLKQVDILNMATPFCLKFGIKLNKNDLSQYVSGKVEPGQNKLLILGLALNVSEAWLMGYDVPRERLAINNLALTEHEAAVITAYRNKPEMQSSVDKLLDVDSPTQVTIFRAARSSDSHGFQIEARSVEDMEKLRDAPTVKSDDDL